MQEVGVDRLTPFHYAGAKDGLDTKMSFSLSYVLIHVGGYLALGNSYRSGCAVGPVVQVLVIGCIAVHSERQNETTWEDSTQGVIHLMGK